MRDFLHNEGTLAFLTHTPNKGGFPYTDEGMHFQFFSHLSLQTATLFLFGGVDDSILYSKLHHAT